VTTFGFLSLTPENRLIFFTGDVEVFYFLALELFDFALPTFVL